jgi:hypothetical protein
MVKTDSFGHNARNGFDASGEQNHRRRQNDPTNQGSDQ